jgi:hypothetical protein
VKPPAGPDRVHEIKHHGYRLRRSGALIHPPWVRLERPLPCDRARPGLCARTLEAAVFADVLDARNERR